MARNNEALRDKFEKTLSYYLQDESFEDFLENFELSPTDVFLCAYNSGLIDDKILETFMVSDAEY